MNWCNCIRGIPIWKRLLCMCVLPFGFNTLQMQLQALHTNCTTIFQRQVITSIFRLVQCACRIDKSAICQYHWNAYLVRYISVFRRMFRTNVNVGNAILISQVNKLKMVIPAWAKETTLVCHLWHYQLSSYQSPFSIVVSFRCESCKTSLAGIRLWWIPLPSRNLFIIH